MRHNTTLGHGNKCLSLLQRCELRPVTPEVGQFEPRHPRFRILCPGGHRNGLSLNDRRDQCALRAGLGLDRRARDRRVLGLPGRGESSSTVRIETRSVARPRNTHPTVRPAILGNDPRGPGARPMSFRFDPSHRPILVKAEVTGPVRSLALQLILDTGATTSLLNDAVLLTLD